MPDIRNGVATAPELSIAPCGLLSVAQVVRHDDEDHQWLRGFSVESNAYPTINLRTYNNDTITGGDLFDGSGKTRHYPVYPFIIEVAAERTGFDLVSSNPLSGSAKDQIEGASQKVAEHELWEGSAARALVTPGTGYLRQTGGAAIVTSGGVDSAKALKLIEQSISGSPTGQRGIIHMTRDVASELGSRLLYKANSRDDDNAYAVTRLGTLVVIGSGYTGNGPIGTTGAAATGTNKWIYATGGVRVDLGVAEFVNDDISQGFDPRTNDSLVLIQRPAATSFDPSLWTTAQVTLT